MADDERDEDETAGDDKEPKKKAPQVIDAEFEESEGEADVPKAARPLATQAKGDDGGDDEGEEEEGMLPAQMGHRRYVYAVFFVLGICLAYFLSRAGLAGWHRLSQWTPKVGEPREDLVTPIAAVISALAVWFTYRRQDVRTLSDEVALELSKVEWPTRDKVRRSTTIVVGASLGASLAFFLYDQIANMGVTLITASKHPILFGLAGGLFVYLVRAFGSRYLAGGAQR